MEALLQLTIENTLPRELKGNLEAALDGYAAFEARELIPLAVRRRYGIFLTESDLAERLAVRRPANKTILDPTCGAGDLLLATARKLPIQPSLEMTLRAWNDQLRGWDLHEELVRAARLRLTLLALDRGAKPRGTRIDPTLLLSNVRVQDALADGASYATTHIVANPPFNPVAARNVGWAQGRISAAAHFMGHFVTNAAEGTHVRAILPDVLRSGSRYDKWRGHMSKKMSSLRTRRHGAFDRVADVDVFILEGEVGPGRQRTNWTPQKAPETLADRYDVSVGPLVDYRDPEQGPERRAVRARGLPKWKTVLRLRESRRFAGRAVQPPFVVVRRTSSPNDRERAVATIIAGRAPTFVENHLLVLKPRRGGLPACERLLRLLHDPATTDWLNKRIRCRHLTVGAVGSIPWRHV